MSYKKSRMIVARPLLEIESCKLRILPNLFCTKLFLPIVFHILVFDVERTECLSARSCSFVILLERRQFAGLHICNNLFIRLEGQACSAAA